MEEATLSAGFQARGARLWLYAGRAAAHGCAITKRRSTMSRVITSDTLNVTLFESGDSITISGLKFEEVDLVLRQLVHLGASVLEEPRRTGPVWTASCRRPEVRRGEAQVEQLGHRFFIRGRSIDSVHAEVAKLTGEGAHLEGPIEEIDDYFIAVCHAAMPA